MRQSLITGQEERLSLQERCSAIQASHDMLHQEMQNGDRHVKELSRLLDEERATSRRLQQIVESRMVAAPHKAAAQNRPADRSGKAGTPKRDAASAS